MQHLRANGFYTGGHAPYGYRSVDGRIEANPTEAAVCERARALRDGGRSLRDVAAALACEGFVNRVGRQFDAKQIARMVAGTTVVAGTATVVGTTRGAAERRVAA
jgi:hypothetical protein